MFRWAVSFRYHLGSERVIGLAQVSPVPGLFFRFFDRRTLSYKIVHFQPNFLRFRSELTPKKLFKYEIDSIA